MYALQHSGSTSDTLAVVTDEIIILGQFLNKNLKNDIYGTYHAVTACIHILWLAEEAGKRSLRPAGVWAESPTISTKKVEMLNHQLTASTSFKTEAARSLALSSGNERKGEEDGSDRRNEFHSRRGVDDFEVSSGGCILQSVQSSSLYLWRRLCFNLLVSMTSKQASAINRIRV
jgi:hypothetical protein